MKEKVIDFEINKMVWTIYLVDEAEMNYDAGQNHIIGLTKYIENEVYILKTLKYKKSTLLHELMHVYMFSYGIDQSDNSYYGFEDICNISASAHEFLNEVLEEFYKKIEEEKNT